MPSKLVRLTGLVTRAVLWTAAVRRTAKEFRFRAAQDSDRPSPVRSTAGAEDVECRSAYFPTQNREKICVRIDSETSIP